MKVCPSFQQVLLCHHRILKGAFKLLLVLLEGGEDVGRPC